MKIWVDADACPVKIKEILYRAAEKRKILSTFVANQPLRIPKGEYLDFLLVAQGFDVADNEIVKQLSPGDLVITADIPLAADVLEKDGHALNPRGELYSKDSIKAKLSVRSFMEDLRSSGVQTGGPPALGPRDIQSFANRLDQLLTKLHRP